MADLTRSPSIQSFASVDSISMLASPAPEAPVIASTALHEDDAPRGTTPVLGEEPVAQSAPQAHRFYIKDGNVKFRVGFYLRRAPASHHSTATQLDDGTLYNVHRYFFDKHAPLFSQRYLCDAGEGIVALQGVSSTDLDRFLAMVYPS